MDPFKPVGPNEPFVPHHEAWNAMLAAAVAHRGGRLTARGGAARLRPSQAVRVRNDTGAGLEAHQAVGLDEPYLSAVDNLNEWQARPNLTAVLPDPQQHTNRFGVTLDPIASDQIGWAVVSGVALCRVMLNNPLQRYATILNATVDRLTSHYVGDAEIIWRPDDGGVQWCVIRIGASARPTYLGRRTTGTGAVSTTGDVRLHKWTGSAWEDQNQIISSCWNFTAPIALNKLVSVTFVQFEPGKPYVPIMAPLEC